MSTREMTYLFVFIALPVMTCWLMREKGVAGLVAVNPVVAAVLFVLEREWGFHYESSGAIRYDRIELVTPEKEALLWKTPVRTNCRSTASRRPRQLPERYRRSAGVYDEPRAQCCALL